MTEQITIGVLGATSHVGQALLPILLEAGDKIIAFSRQNSQQSTDSVTWRPAAYINEPKPTKPIPYWISLAPIWVLPDYFEQLKALGAKRIVALSSTSRFTKDHSSYHADRALAQRFADSEQQLQAWAEEAGIEWIVLRPTLIYGLGKDKNICEIIRLIRRFGFFPLLGEANGLRQPVHCKDVASACVAALFANNAANKSYNLSGAETMSYKEMVVRLFEAIGQKPRFLTVPVSVLRIVFALLRLVPRYRRWSLSMAERMNQDMVFDHQDASRDLNFQPQSFIVDLDSLP